MTEYPIGGIGYCLVEVESRYENKTGIKGFNGEDVIIDTRYEPLKYVKTCGRVIQIPFSLGEYPIYQISVGLPGYGPQPKQIDEQPHAAIYAIGGVYKYKRLSDIQETVNIGDMIWFNRTVLHRPENLVDETERDGVKIFTFKVDYDLIICIEREEPVMIGGWCFLEPIYEDWAKQYIPTFYDTLDTEGKKIPKPQKDWLMIALQPKQEKLRAKLKFFGKPLKGDKFYYAKDAEVFIRRQIQWRYTYVGNKEYMLCKQSDIYAEVVEEETRLIAS